VQSQHEKSVGQPPAVQGATVHIPGLASFVGSLRQYPASPAQSVGPLHGDPTPTEASATPESWADAASCVVPDAPVSAVPPSSGMQTSKCESYTDPSKHRFLSVTHDIEQRRGDGRRQQKGRWAHARSNVRAARRAVDVLVALALPTSESIPHHHRSLSADERTHNIRKPSRRMRPISYKQAANISSDRRDGIAPKHDQLVGRRIDLFTTPVVATGGVRCVCCGYRVT